MTYFEQIPSVGKLELEQTLFEYDKIPMLFVCQSMTDERYLCLCTDMIIEETWLIAKVSNETLIQLIEDKIAILDAYKSQKHPILLARREKAGMRYEQYSFSKLPEEELPDAEEKLENSHLQSYLDKLRGMSTEKQTLCIEPYKVRVMPKERYCRPARHKQSLRIQIDDLRSSFVHAVWGKGETGYEKKLAEVCGQVTYDRLAQYTGKSVKMSSMMIGR